MALCCEMHHRIAWHHFGYRGVANVQTNKLQTGTFEGSSQVAEVPGVGQLVYEDDVVVRALFDM